LRELPAAEVLFNYLGVLDRAQAPSLLFARAAEPPGPQRSARQRRAHLFEIDGGILGGRLRLTWTYSASLHERHTIEALGERWLAALRELTAAALGRRHAGAARTFTPADFGAKLSQKDLDKVIARIGGRRTP
jgi:non-ribosomal peptide synthase protein (TIGR01720 family)